MTVNSIGPDSGSSPLVQPVKETITLPVLQLVKPDPIRVQVSDRKARQQQKGDTVTISNQAIQLSRGMTDSEK
jgi:hypothetical protein